MFSGTVTSDHFLTDVANVPKGPATSLNAEAPLPPKVKDLIPGARLFN